MNELNHSVVLGATHLKFLEYRHVCFKMSIMNCEGFENSFISCRRFHSSTEKDLYEGAVRLAVSSRLFSHTLWVRAPVSVDKNP